MNKTWNILRPLTGLVVLLLVAASSAAWAQDEIIDQLGLSTDQKAKIEKLREDFKKETAPIFSDINRILRQEKDLRRSSPVNQQELRRLLQERADKEIELSLALSRFNEQLEQILTPRQRQTLQKLREQKKR